MLKVGATWVAVAMVVVERVAVTMAAAGRANSAKRDRVGKRTAPRCLAALLLLHANGAPLKKTSQLGRICERWPRRAFAVTPQGAGRFLFPCVFNSNGAICAIRGAEQESAHACRCATGQCGQTQWVCPCAEAAGMKRKGLKGCQPLSPAARLPYSPVACWMPRDCSEATQ